jgi:hypothetical protein
MLNCIRPTTRPNSARNVRIRPLVHQTQGALGIVARRQDSRNRRLASGSRRTPSVRASRAGTVRNAPGCTSTPFGVGDMKDPDHVDRVARRCQHARSAVRSRRRKSPLVRGLRKPGSMLASDGLRLFWSSSGAEDARQIPDILGDQKVGLLKASTARRGLSPVKLSPWRVSCASNDSLPRRAQR